MENSEKGQCVNDIHFERKNTYTKQRMSKQPQFLMFTCTTPNENLIVVIKDHVYVWRTA